MTVERSMTLFGKEAVPLVRHVPDRLQQILVRPHGRCSPPRGVSAEEPTNAGADDRIQSAGR
jgi:hypothetical protein